MSISRSDLSEVPKKVSRVRRVSWRFGVQTASRIIVSVESNVRAYIGHFGAGVATFYVVHWPKKKSVSTDAAKTATDNLPTVQIHLHCMMKTLSVKYHWSIIISRAHGNDKILSRSFIVHRYSINIDYKLEKKNILQKISHVIMTLTKFFKLQMSKESALSSYVLRSERESIRRKAGSRGKVSEHLKNDVYFENTIY